MITAVDTSVLLDVFGADREFGSRSRQAVEQTLAQGSLIACDVVWAEAAAAFPSSSALAEVMDALGVDFSPLDAVCAAEAGAAWRTYRARDGKRDRVIADFLIGAHARHRADRLLTRDRGFYRTCFAELELIDPSRR